MYILSVLDIGNNIKRVREFKGLSQKEVIKAIDMGAAQYSRIENGKTNPSVSTIVKIAKALDIDVYELFLEDKPNSFDKTIIEKVSLIEKLSTEEQKIIFSILDAFLSKQKLDKTLQKIVEDLK